MAKEDFFEVPRKAVETSDGSVELPILYYDVSIIQAFFWCDLDCVAAKLKGTDLAPIRFFTGKALAGIIFFEYRDTTISSYNECGLAVMVRPETASKPLFPTIDFFRKPDARTVGFYVVDLPVTTESACVAGRELWGYPKFVTEIPIKVEDDGVECSVRSPEGNGDIVRFSGRPGTGVSLSAFDLMSYSNRNRELVKTDVDVRAKMKTCLGGDFRVAVGDSQHRMAKNIRDLGLDGAKPFLVQRSDHFQARLNEGRKIAPWEPST
jgi:hypothetical protein